MEVDTGTGDNHYPMNLSISCRRMERTIDTVPLCLLLAPKVVSGHAGIMITTAIIQQINDRLQYAGTIALQLSQKKRKKKKIVPASKESICKNEIEEKMG